MLTFVALVLSFGFLFWYALWEREYTRKQEIAKRQRLFYWYYIFPLRVEFQRTLIAMGERLIPVMQQVGLRAAEAGRAMSKMMRSLKEVGVDKPNERTDD